MRADHTSNESILVRDINEYTDTIGRPCEDGGRDWGDVALKAGRETRFSLIDPQKEPTLPTS